MVQKHAERHCEKLIAMRKKIEQKTGKTPEQLYEEREKRVRDVIELKEPDQIPIWIVPDIASYCNLPRSTEFYEPLVWKKAIIDFTLDFEPDLSETGLLASGPCWETLAVKNRLWPGGPLPSNYEYQFIEGEYMKEDEYDIFLSDPSDFIFRYYLPRIYGSLSPLTKLPPLNRWFNSFEGVISLFACPEYEQIARTLSIAAKEINTLYCIREELRQDLKLLGFPLFSDSGGVGGAPFDTVSSFFRGMKGSMLDMYRRPEKLIQLCEKVIDLRIYGAEPAESSNFPKRVAIPLWRGDKRFMSEDQFRKFYWPGLKKVLLTTMELGYIPIPLFEDHFGDRLKYLLELPKGKMIAVIHHSDIPRAKDILGGHTCIMSTGPTSLKYASLQEVREFYKKQIQSCKKGGGYMLNLSFPYKASTEELKAMVNSIREYLKY